MNLKKCCICKKKFTDHTALDLHMKQVHAEAEHQRIERKHKVIKTKQEEQPNIDVASKDKNKNSLNFTQQVRQEACPNPKWGQEATLLDCSECGIIFKIEDAFKSHMKLHKENKISKYIPMPCTIRGLPLNCGECNEPFNSGNALIKHMQQTHMVASHLPDDCDNCKMRFSSFQELMDHAELDVLIETSGSVDTNAQVEPVNDDVQIRTHMKSVHEQDKKPEKEDIQIEFGDEDDENILPLQYTTKSYPKEPEDPTTVSYKSIQKSILFAKATENLGKILKKDAKITIGKTKAIIRDSRYPAPTRFEAVVEVENSKESGCARVTIWGPSAEGKRKDCTVQITKMEYHPTALVKALAETIVKPLLDHLIENSDTKNAVKSLAKKFEQNDPETKSKPEDEIKKDSKTSNISKLKCTPCKKEFSTIRTMRRHNRDEHVTQRNSKKKIDPEILPSQKRKQDSEKKKNDAVKDSPPRKQRVIEKEPDSKTEDMETENETMEQKVQRLETNLEKKVKNFLTEINNLKTKLVQDKCEMDELKQTIKDLTSESDKTNNKTIPDNINDKIKPVREEHIRILKGFKQVHRGISDGACLTWCTAVHVHNNESEGPNVKSKINNKIADNLDDNYINEIGLPFTETIGVGKERHEITLNTAEELKRFLKDPNSGSQNIYSNQAEIKAISNCYQTNIHIFSYNRPGCEPEWSTIGPDPERTSEAEFPKGAVPDMYLYHEFDCHYELLVDEAKVKKLSKKDTKPINEENTVEPNLEWITIKRSKLNTPKNNQTKERNTNEEDEFLSQSQEEGEILHRIFQRNKTQGFQRTSPLAESEKTDNKSETNNNECKICKETFNSSVVLQTHIMNIHTNLDEIRYVCSVCNKAFTTSMVLQTHIMSIHTNHEGIRNMCTVCNKAFNSSNALKKNIMTIHTNIDEIKHVCSVCNKAFTTLIVLQKHIMNIHTNFEGTRDVCTVCNKAFTSPIVLQTHILNNHSEHEESSEMTNDDDSQKTTNGNKDDTITKSKDEHTLCNVCKLRCSSKKKLETHMKSHREEKRYDMSSLQDAIQIQSNPAPKFNCNKCEEVFKEKNEMRKHIKEKHPSFKPCKNFSTGKRCDFGPRCDYHHVILAEGTFICWDCGHMFSDKNELMVHRKTHGGHTTCKRFLEGQCDRSQETCWYSHSQQETTTTNIVTEDFPKVPQNKAKPTITQIVTDQPEKTAKVTETQNSNLSPLPQREQTQTMLLEVLKVIQNQNKAIMNMMVQISQTPSQ